MVKCVLRCNKTGSKLYKDGDTYVLSRTAKGHNCLNEMLVAEAEFECEQIDLESDMFDWLTDIVDMPLEEILDYLRASNQAFAIHINNIKPYDEPKELVQYGRKIKDFQFIYQSNGSSVIMISTTPVEMYNLLTGRAKGILIRKELPRWN